MNESERNHVPEQGSEHLQWQIPSDEHLVATYMEEFDSLIKQHWPDFDLSKSQLATGFDEALANAIKHGHKNDKNLIVQVEIDINQDQLKIRITDTGEGFDPASVPDPTAPENLLNTTGRGVYITKTLFDEVSYNEKGNEVTLVKHRNPTETKTA